MGFRLKKICQRAAHGALCYTLAWSLAVGPVLFQHAQAANQEVAQQQAADKNDKGADISKILSILSMAMGAMAMAKGAQELSCCQTGCSNGAGTEATANNAAINSSAIMQAAPLAAPPPQEAPPERVFTNFVIHPEYLKVNPRNILGACPKRLPASMDLLYQIVRPQTANAMSCADAMMALAQGGLMMLMGLLGMMGAKKGDSNAKTSYGNAGGLSSLSGVQNAKGASLTGQNNPETIKIDPALLRSPEANSVLSDFEKQFGINRDDFAQAVASGTDPRDILTKAPKNALSAKDISTAMSSANGLSDGQKQAMLDKSGMSALQEKLTAGLGDESNVYGSGGGGASKGIASSKSNSTDLADLLAQDKKENPSVLGLSPDVQAALAARELAASQKSVFEMTLFEVVHRKYRERTTMMHGIGSGKAGVGVANAEGI